MTALLVLCNTSSNHDAISMHASNALLVGKFTKKAWSMTAPCTLVYMTKKFKKSNTTPNICHPNYFTLFLFTFLLLLIVDFCDNILSFTFLYYSLLYLWLIVYLLKSSECCDLSVEQLKYGKPQLPTWHVGYTQIWW